MNSIRPGRQIFLFGPTCVGKGFTGSRIKECHPDIPQVSMGGIFRDMRSQDPNFNKLYGGFMDAGNLIPGLVVLYHAEPKIKMHADKSLLVLDGVIRSVYQATTLNSRGLFGPGDIFCNIHASYDTCHRRHSARIKRNGATPRTDDSAFDDRYRLHQNSTGPVINRVQEIGARVITIDGNMELEDLAQQVLCVVATSL